jgi:hypothetical protein
VKPDDLPLDSNLLSKAVSILLSIDALLASIDKKLTPVEPPGAAMLLRAIYSAIADRTFAASELIAIAQLPEAADLRGAIVDCIGRLNARALGKLLQAVEGDTLDGLIVVRTGSDSAGTLWRVTVAESIPIPVA